MRSPWNRQKHISQTISLQKASKLPKVQASIDFVKAGEGRKAIITDLEHAKAALAGKEGTVITA